MTVARLSETIGVEVQGLDAERLVEDGELPHLLLDLLDRHGVLVFHDLFLDPETQVAFCRRLGEVDMSAGHHRVPGIFWLTMDQSKNPNGDYLRATFSWHIDGCTPLGDEYPLKASVLTAVALGEDGAGPTSPAATPPTTISPTRRRNGSRRCGCSTPSRPPSGPPIRIPLESRSPGGAPVPRESTRSCGATGTGAGPWS